MENIEYGEGKRNWEREIDWGWEYSVNIDEVAYKTYIQTTQNDWDISHTIT